MLQRFNSLRNFAPSLCVFAIKFHKKSCPCEQPNLKFRIYNLK